MRCSSCVLCGRTSTLWLSVQIGRSTKFRHEPVDGVQLCLDTRLEFLSVVPPLEGRDTFGIEARSGLASDDLFDSSPGQRIAIRAVGRHSLANIRDGQHASNPRNRSRSIDDDSRGRRTVRGGAGHVGQSPECANLLQNSLRVVRMLADLVEFFRRSVCPACRGSGWKYRACRCRAAEPPGGDRARLRADSRIAGNADGDLGHAGRMLIRPRRFGVDDPGETLRPRDPGRARRPTARFPRAPTRRRR